MGIQITRLLAGGIVVGPLFVAVWLIQAVTREGFDLTRHPLSLLGLGSLGWIQIANFVVAGPPYVAYGGCCMGLHGFDVGQVGAIGHHHGSIPGSGRGGPHRLTPAGGL